MSSFMEEIADDIDEVFFDVDFFGSIHNVNGEDIPVIVDEDEMQKITKGKNEMRDDVHKDEVLLFLRKKDIGDRRLKVNSILELDKKSMYVHDVKEEMEVFRVVLGRCRI